MHVPIFLTNFTKLRLEKGAKSQMSMESFIENLLDRHEVFYCNLGFFTMWLKQRTGTGSGAEEKHLLRGVACGKIQEKKGLL